MRVKQIISGHCALCRWWYVGVKKVGGPFFIQWPRSLCITWWRLLPLLLGKQSNWSQSWTSFDVSYYCSSKEILGKEWQKHNLFIKVLTLCEFCYNFLKTFWKYLAYASFGIFLYYCNFFSIILSLPFCTTEMAVYQLKMITWPGFSHSLLIISLAALKPTTVCSNSVSWCKLGSP